jgi:hypothetical protein
MGTLHRDDAVIDALLGTPYVRLSKGPNGEEIEEHLRRPDGIWYGPPDGRSARAVEILKCMSAQRFSRGERPSSQALRACTMRASTPGLDQHGGQFVERSFPGIRGGWKSSIPSAIIRI